MLSGPPGCGKTLLARQLARALGAREPMIVNGPEILDKFVGEAEKKIRALFAPAEAEWKAAGDASALHVIVLDEFDSIGVCVCARARIGACLYVRARVSSALTHTHARTHTHTHTHTQHASAAPCRAIPPG